MSDVTNPFAVDPENEFGHTHPEPAPAVSGYAAYQSSAEDQAKRAVIADPVVEEYFILECMRIAENAPGVEFESIDDMLRNAQKVYRVAKMGFESVLQA